MLPPFSSPGDHTVLRFTLLKGMEWLQPQQRDVIASPVQNSELELGTPLISKAHYSIRG